MIGNRSIKKQDEITTIDSLITLPNIPIADYNCGGFALGTYKWFNPFDGDYDDRADRIALELVGASDFDRYRFQKQLFDNEVDYIQKHCSYLKPIKNLRFIPKTATIVAYRNGVFWDEEFEGYQYDFHFKVRSNNQWFEKCGRNEVRCCELMPRSVWDTGTTIYNSPIQYFLRTKFENSINI